MFSFTSPLVRAQNQIIDGGIDQSQNPIIDGGIDQSGLDSSSSNFSGLENPIQVGSLAELVAKLLDVVLTIGIPIVAFFIIYSGFKFVLARGNEEKLQEAKKSIMYTLLGAALLLGAWVLATAIDSIINSIKSAA